MFFPPHFDEQFARQMHGSIMRCGAVRKHDTTALPPSNLYYAETRSRGVRCFLHSTGNILVDKQAKFRAVQVAGIFSILHGQGYHFRQAPRFVTSQRCVEGSASSVAGTGLGSENLWDW